MAPNAAPLPSSLTASNLTPVSTSQAAGNGEGGSPHDDTPSLSSAKRRDAIARLLQSEAQVTIRQLAGRLGVSEVRIRRDLKYLEGRNLLRRVHGGARAVDLAPYQLASMRNVACKQRIGRAAAELVESGQTVLLDSGTTVLEVARHLPERLLADGGLTVVTRALDLAIFFAEHHSTRLLVLGGLYSHDYRSCLGTYAVGVLRGLNVDVAFVGVDGISLEMGPTTDDALEGGIFEMIAKSAGHLVVVTDSSKIGVARLRSMFPLTAIDTFVTDDGAPADFLAALRDMGITVAVVPKDAECAGAPPAARTLRRR